MRRDVLIIESERATVEAGADLARTLRPGSVVLLEGELGAGKTAFVRGLATGLGAPEDEISSPTFTLVQEYRGRIAREREKADYAFAARRKTIERIGLPQVRNYRLNLLSQEERSLQEQLDQKAHALPEMVPLLMVRVEGGGHE